MLRGLVPLVSALSLVFVTSLSRALPPARSPDGGLPSDAGADAAASTEAPRAKPPRPDIVALEALSSRIRALLAGTLDTSIDPSTLFARSLADEDGIRVEVERLRAIVVRADADSDASEKVAVPRATGEKPKIKPPAAGDGDAGAGDAGDSVRELDPELWRAQVELDRARLAIYELPKAERNALFEKHAERQKADREAESRRELTAAEHKVDEAELERQGALEAAKQARTEAERLVAEEHARILGVKKQQAEFERGLIEREEELEKRQEQTLRLRRRVRETIAARRTGSDVAAADALYPEIRAALRPGRDALAEASRQLASMDSGVPSAGEDQLGTLPADVDRRAADEARRTVGAAEARLEQRERLLRAARAKVLADEVTALNGDRLALLPHVSPQKRSAVTGFGPSGLEQAAAEVRQIAVVLGYDLSATLRWLAEIRAPGASRGKSAASGVVIALKWLLPIGLFVWWRRRAVRVLENLRETIRESERKSRPRAVAPSWNERAVTAALRLRSPIEWLALLWAVVWLLPPEAAGLLEVRLVSTVFIWTLGGAIAVQLVDMAVGAESARRIRRSKLQTAHLRMQSLRLMSRVIVAFALVLVLTSQLVGKGTIYGWVWSFCWIAAIPVALVLVRWWRAVIFERVELKRRKTAVERWVIANAAGWTSFPAAVVGGVLLLASGIYRELRERISTFTLTRRILAYLFSREIGKKAEEQAKIIHEKLEPRAYAVLGPETASKDIVPSVADEHVADVIRKINLPGGGVFAIVGERGSGKTRLLHEIQKSAVEARVIQCPFGGMQPFARAFLEAFGGKPDETLEVVAARNDAAADESGILIDDAHRLILPKMGGLRAFDRVLALARAYSVNSCWVFAFDDVIWRFFERMRGAKPVFDDVIHLDAWEEEAVARLIRERTMATGLRVDFSALLPELPADADEIDIEEALARTEQSYYRLLWDYAGGNPGVALHAWRSALGVTPDATVRARIFQPPKIAELERLPDPAVFVLRALVQLERASVAELAAATGVGLAQVGDAIRFGLARGYVERTKDDAYSVTWTWFRSLTRFLQRRHLLFAD